MVHLVYPTILIKEPYKIVVTPNVRLLDPRSETTNEETETLRKSFQDTTL